MCDAGTPRTLNQRPIFNLSHLFRSFASSSILLHNDTASAIHLDIYLIASRALS